MLLKNTHCQGGKMTKLITIPRSQIMDTPTEMLIMIVGQSGHRLSPECKRDIAAVIKARNNSEK